ncbi:hypothetical protein, partial [Rhodobacter capsulatus]|uniref:hypothetical protein n=1 Tax=Rhodobacter capsulatus TaxID=1061 RepID=UPI0012FF166E
RAANPSILIAANHPRNPFKAWEFSHSTPDSIPANLLNYPKAEKLNQLITQQQTNEMNRSGSATSSLCQDLNSGLRESADRVRNRLERRQADRPRNGDGDDCSAHNLLVSKDSFAYRPATVGPVFWRAIRRNIPAMLDRNVATKLSWRCRCEGCHSDNKLIRTV